MEHQLLIRCTLGEIITPGRYWMTQYLESGAEDPDLKKVEICLSEAVKKVPLRFNTADLQNTKYVAVQDCHDNNLWHRGKVKEQLDTGRFQVFLCDFGKYVDVEKLQLRLVPADLMPMDDQRAFMVFLNNIVPTKPGGRNGSCNIDFVPESKTIHQRISTEWRSEAYNFVKDLFGRSKEIYVRSSGEPVCSYVLGDVYVRLSSLKHCKSVGKLLCTEKYAVMSEQHFSDEMKRLQEKSEIIPREPPLSSDNETVAKVTKWLFDQQNVPANDEDDDRPPFESTPPSSNASESLSPLRKHIMACKAASESSHSSINFPSGDTDEASDASPLKKHNLLLKLIQQSREMKPKSCSDVSDGLENSDRSIFNDCLDSKETEVSFPAGMDLQIPIADQIVYSPAELMKIPESAKIEYAPAGAPLRSGKKKSTSSPKRNEQNRLSNNFEAEEVGSSVSMKSSVFSRNKTPSVAGSSSSSIDRLNRNEVKNLSTEDSTTRKKIKGGSLTSEDTSSSRHIEFRNRSFSDTKTRTSPVKDHGNVHGRRPKKTNLLDILSTHKETPEPDIVTSRTVQDDHYLSSASAVLQEPQSTSIFLWKPLILGAEGVLEPVTSVKDLWATHHLIRNLEAHAGYKNLFGSQRWGIPIIQRGVNMVSIGVARTGKTMSYVIPIANAIQDEHSFEELPDGNGPLAVVVCSSSRSAEFIHIMFHILLGNVTEKQRSRSKYKVLVVHGGGSEKEMWVELTNGCEVLITTPHCLVRLLEHRSITNFERLCYLVLDEADILTKSTFVSQLRVIVEKAEQVKRKRDLQTIIVGEKWTPSMISLSKLVERKGVLMFGSYLEAAIYSKLKPDLLLLETPMKVQTVLDRTKKKIGHCKILIVCDYSEQQQLYEAYKTLGQIPLKAHDRMLHSDIKSVRQSWDSCKKGQYPILICTDDVLHELNIQDVHYLVHYSLPCRSKTQFSFRFSTLLKNYPELSKVGQDVQPLQVLILIDNENHWQFPHVVEFARRLGAVIEPKIFRACDEIRRQIELEKGNVPVCPNVLEFGECINEKECPRRHALLKDVDAPDEIPANGTVKFQISKVHNACYYSAKLMEHISPDGKVTSLVDPKDSEFSEQLKEFYNCESNRKAHGVPKVGDLCAFKDESGFNRAEVIEYTKVDKHGQPIDVTLRLIDDGNVVFSKTLDLYELPESLAKRPPQVVQIYACGLFPTDFDRNWSRPAFSCMQKLVTSRKDTDHYWIGRVVLSLKNKLWLDPIRLGRFLQVTSTHITEMSVKEHLLGKSLAVKNDDHVTRLKQLFEAAEIPVAKNERSIKKTCSVVPQWAHFQDETVRVRFTYAKSTSSIYVYQCKFQPLLRSLQEDLKEAAEKMKKKGEKMKEIVPQSYCMALSQDTIEECSDGIDIFFVDYGDNQLVNRESVLPIPDDLIMKLPFQAIECSLIGVAHPKTCSPELIDVLYDFSQDGALDLHALVISKDVTITGQRKYNVVLVNSEQQSLNKLIIDDKWVRPVAEEVSHLENIKVAFSEEEEEHEQDEWEEEEEEEEEDKEEGEGKNQHQPSEEEQDLGKDEKMDLVDPEYIIKMLEGNKFDDEDSVGFFQEILNVASRGWYKIQPIQKQEQKETKTSGSDFLLKLYQKRQSNKKQKKVQEIPGLSLPKNNLTPNVSWSQSSMHIKLKIEVIGVTEYSLTCTDKNLIFRCDVNDKSYAVDLKLFGSVNPDLTRVEVKAFCVQIVLKKLCGFDFPRLQADECKMSFIKHDPDAMMEEEEDDDIIKQIMKRSENKEYSQEFKPRRDEHIDPVPDFVSESGSSDLEYEFNDDILG